MSDVKFDRQQVEDFVAEWCQALRSGKYKQTRGVLHNKDTDSYCCLGVACDLLKDRLGLLTAKDSLWYGNRTSECVTYDGEGKVLPEPVTRALGMTPTGNPYDWTMLMPQNVGWVPVTADLVSLNDAGYTFDEIADIIERNKAKIFRKLR